MNKFMEYLLGFLALIGLGTLAMRKPKVVDASKETKKIDDKIKEIKEQTNESDLSDLVGKSNQRYGPGSGSGDS